ncbi:MAG TPA: hypothetical protein VF730_07625 [Terracidiphilus sp.]|jgi:hypothetical protein|nr:hypothetical protein [Rhizomicrobium sp.]
MRQVSAFAISVLTLLSLTSAARAGAFDAMAQNSCEQAVEEKIKASHSDASDIAYSGERMNQAETNTSVKGKGNFTVGGNKQSFSYTCNYNIVSGDTSGVNVQMSSATASN